MGTRLLITAVSVLAALWVGSSPALGSSGRFTFHVSVSGKGHDSGTISAAEHASTVFDATGCAIIKESGSAKKIFGAYIFEVRFAGSNTVLVPGVKPNGPYVLMEVDHYRPSVGTYRTLDVSGSFAINGRTYGGGVKPSSVVHIRNSGRDGTWNEPQAHRSYPAKPASPIEGYKFTATWHCRTVFHLTQPRV